MGAYYTGQPMQRLFLLLSRRLKVSEYPLQQIFRSNFLLFSLLGHDQPSPVHAIAKPLHVLGCDITPAVEKRLGLGTDNTTSSFHLVRIGSRLERQTFLSSHSAVPGV